MKEKDQKINVTVKIENEQIFAKDYVVKQKLKVIVNKTVAHFNIDSSEERILRKEDGTELNDLGQTIEDVGIRDGETLTYIKKSPRPPRKEGFAS